MSDSVKEIVIRFFLLFLIFMILPRISDFFKIGLGQALGMAVGITLLDLVIYTIKKAKNSKI